TLRQLTALYKQINAPFGELAMRTLDVSTAALASDTPGDSTYASLQARIASWTARRDALAGEMGALLHGAAFDDDEPDEVLAREMVDGARSLLAEVAACAADIPGCID